MHPAWVATERRASTRRNMAACACRFFQEIGGIIRIPE
jgi:hypothetical protein